MHVIFWRNNICYSCIAWKGHLRNDLYCVGRDVKPYSLTHSLVFVAIQLIISVPMHALPSTNSLL